MVWTILLCWYSSLVLLYSFRETCLKKCPQTNKLPKTPPLLSAWILDIFKPTSATSNLNCYMSMLENLICWVFLGNGTQSVLLNFETSPSRISAWAWFGRQHDWETWVRLCTCGHTMETRGLRSVVLQIHPWLWYLKRCCCLDRWAHCVPGTELKITFYDLYDSFPIFMRIPM